MINWIILGNFCVNWFILVKAQFSNKLGFLTLFQVLIHNLSLLINLIWIFNMLLLRHRYSSLVKKSKAEKVIIKVKEALAVWIGTEESYFLSKGCLNNWAISWSIDVKIRWFQSQNSYYLRPKIFHEELKQDHVILWVKHYCKVDFFAWTPKSYIRKLGLTQALELNSL